MPTFYNICDNICDIKYLATGKFDNLSLLWLFKATHI